MKNTLRKEKNIKSLNEALRLFRVFHDLTLKELAEQLDVSPGYVSSIELGRKTPNLELVEKYAKIFKTTPSAILFFSEDLSSKDFKNKIRNSVRSLLLRFLQALEHE